MNYELKLYGPIEIHYNNEGSSKSITSESKKSFIEDLRKLGIAGKDGCYIFALRNAKGCTPWYVGKATAGMADECMADHKQVKYAQVFSRGHKGTPVMFFVCQPGSVNNLSAKVCDEMEDELIQFAKSKNPELLNKMKAKLPEWSIEGVLRGGKRPSADEKLFARAMWIGLQ